MKLARLGVALTPLFLGGMAHPGQALVGVALGMGLVSAKAGPLDRFFLPFRTRTFLLLSMLLLLPFIPLPGQLVAALSPEKARLAREFPVISGGGESWMPLAVSTLAGLQRVWELVLALGVFFMFRFGARLESRSPDPHPASSEENRTLMAPGLTPTVSYSGRRVETDAPCRTGFLIGLAWVLSAVLIVEVGVEWIRLLTDRAAAIEWLTPSWGVGAGTFANRNHFANWVAMSSWVCVGGFLACTGRRDRSALWFAATAAAGAMAVVLSGSRGGLLGVGAGALAFLLLARRFQVPIPHVKRFAWMGGVALAGIIAVSGPALRRLSTEGAGGHGALGKRLIWTTSLELAAKFPLMGTGWGGFEPAFNLSKRDGGAMTYLHAENDYLESWIEIGVIGAAMLLAAIVPMMRRLAHAARHPPFQQRHMAMVFGLVSALVTFLVQASVEFVAQIPANLMLAAGLLGALDGLCGARPSEEREPAILRGASSRRGTAALAGAGAVILLIACCQAGAWICKELGNRWDRMGRQTDAVRALKLSHQLWLPAADREIGRIRAEVKSWSHLPIASQGESARRLSGEIAQGLKHDLLNWELRWERLWLELAFRGDPDRARKEAWRVHHLNPRQHQIPLRLARHYARLEPETAQAFLLALTPSSQREAEEILRVASQSGARPAEWWRYVPDTAWGLRALGDFALEKRLTPMAAAAYGRANDHAPDALNLGDDLLRCGRPIETVQVLQSLPSITPRRQLLLARARLQLADAPGAVREIEQGLASNAARAWFALSPPPSARDAETEGTRLALEAASRAPPSAELSRLEELTRQHPKAMKLRRSLFQALSIRQEFARAAQEGVALLELMGPP